jgi:hypothetical protein
VDSRWDRRRLLLLLRRGVRSGLRGGWRSGGESGSESMGWSLRSRAGRGRGGFWELALRGRIIFSFFLFKVGYGMDGNGMGGDMAYLKLALTGSFTARWTKFTFKVASP